MIFVTVGSREYPFDRLLMKLDDLCAEGRLPEPLFAQIGQSPYVPKHYDFVRYLDTDAFYRCQSEASLVISHAGTGALIGALKRGRQVVSVPRRKALGEHIDDHQLQVSEALSSQGYLRQVLDMDDLEATVRVGYSDPIQKSYDRPRNVVPVIEAYLKEHLR